MPSLNFNQITKAYKGTQQLDKIYHGDKQIFPITVDYSNGDPHWNNVVFYLRGDSLIDVAKQKQVVNNNNVVVSTAQSKYGGKSLLFSGSNWLSVAPNSDFVISGDFCIEAWHFCTSSTAKQCLAELNGGYLQGILLRSLNSEGTTYALRTQCNPNPTVLLNTWRHIAVSRSSNVVRFFIDGTLIQTTTISGTINSVAELKIGDDSEIHSVPFVGHLSSFRITTGIARYTANFNPETDTYLAY